LLEKATATGPLRNPHEVGELLCCFDPAWRDQNNILLCFFAHNWFIIRINNLQVERK
jgi:hypothetical protein